MWSLTSMALIINRSDAVLYATQIQKRWVTLKCILMCQCESWVRIYIPIHFGIYVFVGRCFSVWVTVHICKCISVYQSQSLSWLPTQSALWQGLPEAGPNERISIWQEWILNCALTDGWIRRDGAPFQQDLHCDLENVWGEGALGGKCMSESWRAKIWLLWWSIILSITGKSSWCHYMGP